MSKKEFTRLFETIRGERPSDLDNDRFLVLAEMLHSAALARLFDGVERQNLVKTAGPAIQQQVRDITGAPPFPSLMQ
jgi:hypothetical protein